MRNIINQIAIVIVAIIAFAGVVYVGMIKPSTGQYVGQVVSVDSSVSRSLVMLNDGRIMVSTCTKQEIVNLKWSVQSNCISTKWIGNGDFIVKSVVAEYTGDVRMYIDSGASVYMNGVYMVNGYLSSVHQ